MSVWSSIFKKLQSKPFIDRVTRSGLKRGDFVMMVRDIGNLKRGQEVMVSSVYDANNLEVVSFGMDYYKVKEADVRKHKRFVSPGEGPDILAAYKARFLK